MQCFVQGPNEIRVKLDLCSNGSSKQYHFVPSPGTLRDCLVSNAIRTKDWQTNKPNEKIGHVGIDDHTRRQHTSSDGKVSHSAYIFDGLGSKNIKQTWQQCSSGTGEPQCPDPSKPINTLEI